MVVTSVTIGNDGFSWLRHYSATGYRSCFFPGIETSWSPSVYCCAMRTPLVIASSILVLNSPLPAQGTRVMDQGSFTISINGGTVGRENFSISAANRGNVTEYVARADVTYGDRRVRPELHAGTDGTVAEYTVTTRSGGTSESWSGAIAGGRLNAKIAS